MRWFVFAAVSVTATLASAQTPSQIELNYAAGNLRAASAALAAHGPTTDGERLVACRLSLFSNRVAEARSCSAALLAASPRDRAALQLAAEAAWRAGDYIGAANARTALGSIPSAERLRWFATNPPYAHGSLRDDHIALERVDPLPIVRARLGDGVDRFFIIDTGGGDTVIDRNLAASADIRTFGDQGGVFGGGQVAQIITGVAPTLRIGRNELRNIPVTLLDTAAYDQVAPGMHISGVIGTGLLSRFVATLDYRQNRLLLRQHRASARRSDVVAPFWLFNDHYLVTEARVNDHPFLAFIDTGLAGNACTAPRSTLDVLGISAGTSTQGGANGAGQAINVAPFTANLAIGAASMTGAPCLFGPFPPQIEALAGSHLGVLVSHAFFRGYAVTFDFNAMQIVLSR